MAIKNYTSGVDIYTSLGEIQGALARAGHCFRAQRYNNIAHEKEFCA